MNKLTIDSPWLHALWNQYYLPHTVPGLVDLFRLPRLQRHAFPRIIHQSYKTTALPSFFTTWRQSWIDENPQYEYRFWTDDANRAFIQREYPWFLSYYDEYNMPIKRADAMRVFYLFHYGGIYADMDMVCIRNFDSLFDGQPDADVVLGAVSEAEPVGNALMISRPRATFWLHAMRALVRRRNCYIPEFDTGPMMIDHVRRTQRDPRVVVLPSTYFYPIDWRSTVRGTHMPWYRLRSWKKRDPRFFNASFVRRVGSNRTYTGTPWAHTWKGW